MRRAKTHNTNPFHQQALGFQHGLSRVVRHSVRYGWFRIVPPTVINVAAFRASSKLLAGVVDANRWLLTGRLVNKRSLSRVQIAGTRPSEFGVPVGSDLTTRPRVAP